MQKTIKTLRDLLRMIDWIKEYLFLMLREFQRPTFTHLSDRLPAALEAGDRADKEFSGVRVELSEREGDDATGEHDTKAEPTTSPCFYH